jgi:hypothetical protein
MFDASCRQRVPDRQLSDPAPLTPIEPPALAYGPNASPGGQTDSHRKRLSDELSDKAAHVHHCQPATMHAASLVPHAFWRVAAPWCSVRDEEVGQPIDADIEIPRVGGSTVPGAAQPGRDKPA